VVIDSDRRTIEQFKRLMVERGVPLVETIAFGSRARGDGGPESDLDILVIVDHYSMEIRETISHCAWQAGLDAGVIIQSAVMTRDEVENSPQRSSLFMISVRRDGVMV